jgi:hypothetical protein
MPGFWGQYGPKARSASFLGPLHYAYDHFDHEYRSTQPNIVDNQVDDIVKVNYTYSSLPDVRNLAANDNVIIPLYFLQDGQRLLNIEGVNSTPFTPPTHIAGFNSSMGIWLYTTDFELVWDQRLWQPSDAHGASVGVEPIYSTSMPTDIDTRTLCELGPHNMIKLGYPNLYRAVDLTKAAPPFRDSDTNPGTPFRKGHYICLCIRKSQTPTSQLLLQIQLEIAGNRHDAL